MAGNGLRYDRMVEEALRGVVRKALEEVAARKELPGAHHFYLTFRTACPGVEIPDYLHEAYPKEMTIVLQHQFWHLTVGKDSFSVTLSFNRMQERLSIPFAAMVAFADPSVPFALQFHPASGPSEETIGQDRIVTEAPQAIMTEMPQQANSEAAGALSGEAPPEPKADKVVALDQFRKNK
jgi:hypothetical protein